MKQRKHTFSYVCDDCSLMFQTFGKPKNRKPFCPSCGDNVSVSSSDGIHRDKEDVKNLKTRWKTEELDILQLCVNGKIQPYQVALRLGRSIDSVNKKLKRVRG